MPHCRVVADDDGSSSVEARGRLPVIILGEHDKGLGMPFSPSTVSGRRLRAMIAEAGLAAQLGNVFEFRGGEVSPRDLRDECADRRVVAVGKVAAAECARQGIDHRYLPHPAVRSAAQLACLMAGLHQLAREMS